MTEKPIQKAAAVQRRAKATPKEKEAWRSAARRAARKQRPSNKPITLPEFKCMETE